ncbi:MAG: endopeptidase IV [Gammaproteobacteria bacterium]|jgi:hypothetical protein
MVMRYVKSVLGLVLVLMLMNSVWARSSAEDLEGQYSDPAKSPLGCRDAGHDYTWNIVRLNHVADPNELGQEEGGQALYFLYNRTKQPIYLNQILRDDSTRSTYLNHMILPQQWAVLATNQKELRYICSVNSEKSKYGKIVNCQDSLKVCEYVRVKFGMNNRGNFWIVESANRGSAVGQVVRYGIIPR